MNRAALRWTLTTTALAALLATAAPAHADGPGTPNQPPPDPPPGQPQPQPVQVQPQPVQVQPQPQQVPPYGTYQQRRKKQSHWYGWQTLIVDGAWIIGSPVLAGAGAGDAAGALALGGYLLGAPIVHWSHAKVGIGFASFGIRVGAPLLLGLGGYSAAGGNKNGYDGAVGAAIGVLLGMVGAIVVDAAVLSYETADEDDEDAKLRTRQRNALRPATLTPMLAPRTEGGAVGAVLGVSGTLF